MRLLSNLYKQRFITNESESRVINSNTLAYRILEEQSRALAKTREPEQPQAESGGFVEGIAAPQVETIDYEAEAKEKAEEILAQANAEADEIRKAAREEADEIRKQAQEQGQAEGLEQGMQEGAAVYDAKLESIGKREQQLQDSYLEQMRELEPKLVHTITDVVSHIFQISFHVLCSLFFCLLSCLLRFLCCFLIHFFCHRYTTCLFFRSAIAIAYQFVYYLVIFLRQLLFEIFKIFFP